jgi:hypothetical protein
MFFTFISTEISFLSKKVLYLYLSDNIIAEKSNSFEEGK